MELKRLVSWITKPFSNAAAREKDKPEPVLARLPSQKPSDNSEAAFYKGYNSGDLP